MSRPFLRSTAALDADQSYAPVLWSVVVVILLGVWLAWFVRAPVSVYETSQSARLEAGQAVNQVQVVVAGRVLSAPATLGQQVCPGDVLLQLDPSSVTLQLREELARREVLAPQLAALAREVETQQRAMEEQESVARAAINESAARRREAHALARYSEERATRLAQMRDARLVANFDLETARAEAEQRRWNESALQRTSERLERERRSQLAQRQVVLDELARQRASLEAQLVTSQATIARLEHDVELHTIHAPVCGRIGELVPLRAGAYVQAGDRIASVVPPGAVRIVAQFLPTAAIGRIRPGQPATMRLDGFPWTEYGVVNATVTSVANEAQDGRVRVELAVRDNPRSAIPIQHGLPGSLEVVVGRMSPAQLLLRAAGQWRTAAEH